MSNVNTVVFTIVLVLFVIVTLVGFGAARWRRAGSGRAWIPSANGVSAGDSSGRG